VLQATLAEAPDPRRARTAPVATGTAQAGLLVEPMTAELQRAHDLPSGLAGVVVAEVEAESPAARAGLQRGDLILEVDRKPVSTPADLAQTLQPGHSAMLLVWRDGNASFVPLRP